MEITLIKGFKDILPDEVLLWQKVESIAREIFRTFGFQEIRPPFLERTELFSRSIGQDTDIVSKEMYTFHDSKGRGLTLRPEATASVVRAYIQHGLFRDNQVKKFFSIGPMFRHERPQKGRFRQFHQINAEVFGDEGPCSDADLINMAVHILHSVGVKDFTLFINSLGCSDCRVRHRKELKEYLFNKLDDLCSDCRKRAEVNPLRVFDCKVEKCKEVIHDAPSILEYLCEDCKEHFRLLQDYLMDLDIEFSVDHRLVRGLDYYSRTAFEFKSDALGSQDAIGGGGRYDTLVKQLGGPDRPGLGFAIGFERFITLINDMGEDKDTPDFFLAGLGEKAMKKILPWVSELRKSGLWVEMEYGAKGLKAQMKKADKLGAKRTLIIGEDELCSGKGILRDMMTKDQQEIELDNLVESLMKIERD